MNTTIRIIKNFVMPLKASVRRRLLGLTGVSTVAAGASYYYLHSRDSKEKIDLSKAITKIKSSNKTDWGRTVSEIQKTPENKLPEGLRAAKAITENAENWIRLFCAEAEHDANDSNIEDYLKYCT